MNESCLLSSPAASGGYAQLPAVTDSRFAHELGVTRLFHLEAAGAMLRPREVVQPNTDDLFDSANGLCLVDRIDPMRAGRGAVYLWHQASCPPQRKDAALQLATQYLLARNTRLALPPNAQVEVVEQGRETPLFMRCFTPWRVQ